MQFEFAGLLGLPDGRYLSRPAPPGDPGAVPGDADPGERVLVVETDGAPPPPRRRRRRSRAAEAGEGPAPLPLSRVTAIFAERPIPSDDEAAAWLAEQTASAAATGVLLGEGATLLNRALHAYAVANADPRLPQVSPEGAATALIGYGSGEQVASGRFEEAHRVDPRTAIRRGRSDDLGPQGRLAAVLGGRAQLDACETLLLRARADLDAGRTREAALQLRVALEALLVELADALEDEDHARDIAALEQGRGETGAAANAALRGELSTEQSRQVAELTALAERVIRRRRILSG